MFHFLRFESIAWRTYCWSNDNVLYLACSNASICKLALFHSNVEYSILIDQLQRSAKHNRLLLCTDF